MITKTLLCMTSCYGEKCLYVRARSAFGHRYAQKCYLRRPQFGDLTLTQTADLYVYIHEPQHELKGLV